MMPRTIHRFYATGSVLLSAVGILTLSNLADPQRSFAQSPATPYKDGKGFTVQRKWANLFEGGDVFIASMLGFALTAPGYSLADINDWFEGQNVSAEHLVPQISVLDPKLLGGEFAVPVFVIQGAEDFTTPTSLAKTYLNSLHAPRKAFAAIDGAGHFAVFTKQDVFLKELRALVSCPGHNIIDFDPSDNHETESGGACNHRRTAERVE